MPVTPVNPALRVAGPCLIRYKGKLFFSQGDVTADPTLGIFNVESGAYDPDPREDTLTFLIKCVPVGYLDAIDALYYTGNIIGERLLHHTRTFLPAAVNAASDVITIVKHRFRNGAGVTVVSRGTLPAGLTANLLVYLHSLTADTFTLHTTEADALAGTNPINITSAGIGDHKIIEQEYLEIHSLTDGEKYRFHNTAVVGIPTFTAKANAPCLGEVTFEAFRRFGAFATATDAFYTRTIEDNADAGGIDWDQVITEAATLSWGAVKPFDTFATRDGAAIAFNLTTAPVPDGAGGISSRKITGQTVTLVCEPLNVSSEELFAKRTLQGAGAGTGRRVAAGAASLDMTADHYFARLYGAFITTAPTQWSKTNDRVGAVTWQASRTYSGGTALPLYYLGASAPV